MPAGDFTAALTERVDYAVFVAYEAWAREVAYTAHNPYDVLARLLDGLPQALTTAMAERGGWVTLDPAGAPQAADTRQLISEMATQVMVARIQAEAADLPEIGLLTGLIVDAVSGAITLFIEQPGTFDLARAEASAAGPLGARSQPEPAAVANSEAPMQLAELPPPVEAPAPVAETPPASELQTDPFGSIEAWLNPFLQAFRSSVLPSNPLIVLGAGGETGMVGQDGTIDIDIDWRRPEELAGGDSTTELMPGIDLADPDLPDSSIQGAGGSGSDGRVRLSSAERDAFIARIEALWRDYLADADFFRAEDGVVVKLTEAEEVPVVDMIVAAKVAEGLQDVIFV
jgi:hypothetical protein